MKKKKLELKKEVIVSLNKNMMAGVLGGDVLGPTYAPSYCVCLISEKSPCQTEGFNCIKFTDFPCKLSDACDTVNECTPVKTTVFPCKSIDCVISEFC